MENVNRKLGILAVIKNIFGNNDIEEIDKDLKDLKDLLDAQNRADGLAVGATQSIVEEGVRDNNRRENLKIIKEKISSNIKLSDENEKNKYGNQKNKDGNERI